jgi:hypothetical protein
MKIKIFSGRSITFYLVLFFIIIITRSSSCGGDDIKINYEYGTFPDSVYNLEGMNSEYDDYNMALPEIYLELPIMFSSNRSTSGGTFDITSGLLAFLFNQIDGNFSLYSEMLEAQFYNYLEDLVNTDTGNEFGPMRFFNGSDGYEYFFYASDYESDNLDLKFVRYFPSGGQAASFENYKGEVNVLNSSSDDAYITLDRDIENAYFTSDRDGDFDIFETAVTQGGDFTDWLEGSPGTITATDSVNSDYNDKCPYIANDIMIFTSDRPGGMGGYDLYYSIMTDDKWSSPINMGPRINTEYNEYRPLLGFSSLFTNKFILFSSDRPGGKGGYDLYFTGIDL